MFFVYINNFPYMLKKIIQLAVFNANSENVCRTLNKRIDTHLKL